MATLGLFAMSGLIGMAVDFGWSYFLRRTAQSAADAAAMAAANAAMDAISSGSSMACGGALTCVSSPTNCGSLSGNLNNACQYAQQNGFTPAGDYGRQTVTVNADVTSPPPTVPGVSVHYWVTVRITNTIPQLYSAVLGNANATIAARSTAAIVDTVVNAAALGLNRNDTGAHGYTDMWLGTGSRVLADTANGKGIVLSSTDGSSGNSNSTRPSSAAYTLTRGGLTPLSSWPNPHTNQGDSSLFSDPMRYRGQPPLTTTNLTAYPVPGGVLNTSVSGCSSGSCGPGVYFATANGVATGASHATAKLTSSSDHSR